MSKRAASLAQIQTYLDTGGSGAVEASTQDETPAPPSVVEPHAAPGTQAQAQAEPTTQAQGETPEGAEITDEQRSAVEERTDVAAARLRQVVNYGKFRLEAFPMPGGLFLPIALLLILFIALLPIAGKTRLQWLWDVIAGNAALDQAEDVIDAGIKLGGPPPPLAPGNGNITPTSPAPTTQTPVPPISTGIFFTGVEEL